MQLKFTYTAGLVWLCSMLVSVQAQVREVGYPSDNSWIEVGDQQEQAAANRPNSQSAASPEAQWDIRFNYAVGDSAGVNGQAAAIYFGNEFWTSRWANDTIYRFTSTGSIIDTFFLALPGGGGNLSGTRAFTRDDTSIYIANNTTEIFEVDPTTRTIINTIQTTSPVNLRFLTYDSTANGGNGGFWAGNFNTEILLLSRTGTVLSTILPTTHNLGGMYGAAVDNVSAGGPYLWVFQQDGAASSGVITQLSLPSGTQTFVSRDVTADISSDPSDLAGGLFISDEVVPGELTLMGLLQAGPNRLFGYDLDFVPINTDAAFGRVNTSDFYSRVPEKLASPVMLIGEVQNQGAETLDTALVELSVDSAGVVIQNDSELLLNISSANISPFMLGPFNPQGKATYDFNFSVSTGDSVDQDPSDNARSISYTITDSVLARDYGVSTGPYGVDGSGGILAVFDFNAPAFVQGVEIVLDNPTPGDTMYPIAVATAGGVPSGLPVMVGDTVFVDSLNDTYFLPFNEPIEVLPGIPTAFGIYQESNIGMATSQDNFREGVNFFSGAALNVWGASSIASTRFIRPVLATCSKFDVSIQTFPDSGNSQGAVLATPENSLGIVFYQWDNGANGPVVTGLPAGEICLTATDGNGCVVTKCALVATVNQDADLDKTNISLQPNPVDDWLEVQLSPDLQLTQWQVLDLQGKQLMGAKGVFQGQWGIDVSLLSPGVYILQGENAKSSFQQQFIVR